MIELTTPSQLKSLLEENKNRSLVILKHSTRCPASAMAFAEFERFAGKQPDITCAFIKLIEHRDVNDLLTELSGITHQSPQVFLFNRGELIWDASHSEIQEDSLESHLPSST